MTYGYGPPRDWSAPDDDPSRERGRHDGEPSTPPRGGRRVPQAPPPARHVAPAGGLPADADPISPPGYRPPAAWPTSPPPPQPPMSPPVPPPPMSPPGPMPAPPMSPPPGLRRPPPGAPGMQGVPAGPRPLPGPGPRSPVGPGAPRGRGAPPAPPGRRGRPGRPARRSLPPLPQTKGISLREFPGLLKQLPQHRPWVIAISVISSLVVLATCGFGTYQLLRDEAVPLGMPTDGPTVEYRDISTRDLDPTPLTAADVFPEREVVVEDGIPPYTMIGDPQVLERCTIAGDVEVRHLLENTDCTQVLRATFNSYDDHYFATAGVLNLKDTQSATEFADQIKDLVDTNQGSLRGYISDPNIDNAMGYATSRNACLVRGHFVLYVVVVRKDRADIGTDRQAVDVIVDDLLRRYLRDVVMTRWSEATEAPPSDASAAPTTATG